MVARLLFYSCPIFVLLSLGCGTTRTDRATRQLLLSDAVDRAVAQVDFSPLEFQRVYLDSRYIQEVSDKSFVNADYIISSLRQQMLSAGCLIQESAEDAEFIVEARVGTLGTDGHDVNYGIPASNALNAAASVVSATPALPALPDISLARKSEDSGAAKIAVFAYHRETRRPVWKSGISLARSTARGTWVLGAGPFQSGTIYNGAHFAGEKIRTNPFRTKSKMLDENYTYEPRVFWTDVLRRPDNVVPSEDYIASLGETVATPTYTEPRPSAVVVANHVETLPIANSSPNDQSESSTPEGKPERLPNVADDE